MFAYTDELEAVCNELGLHSDNLATLRDAKKICLRSNDGDEIELLTYDSPQTLFSAWRAELGIGPEVSLADTSTESIFGRFVLGDVWRQDLGVGTAPIGRPRTLDELIYTSLRLNGAPLTAQATALQRTLLDKCRTTRSDAPDHPFLSNRHVLLAGPTSSGKTNIATAFMISEARQGAVFYVAPTRALTQEVYAELRTRLSFVGLFDGTGERPLILSTGEDTEDDWRLRRSNFGICVLFSKRQT